MSVSLDLGCGQVPHNLFKADSVFGIDIVEVPSPSPHAKDLNGSYIGLVKQIVSADLAIHPIPFSSSSFDYCTAVDFLEHIPRILYTPHRTAPFIQLMNEIHRILKPGGHFYSISPYFPATSAFTDPTHVNYITDDTFRYYFDDKNMWGRDYGITACFEVIKLEKTEFHLHSILRKA